MTFGERAIGFFDGLKVPVQATPAGIEVMDPVRDRQVREILSGFYSRFYSDVKSRIFLIGINPGRFGGGITGIPFTDPVNLDKVLGIRNDLDKKHELSSRFIYRVIDSLGGPVPFFGHFYLTAVSPYGFTREGRNLNYYDDRDLMNNWKPHMIRWLRQQVAFGAGRSVAFSLGTGKNAEYLRSLNEEGKFFDEIRALPHPRWVMQYRYRRMEEFIDEYTRNLRSVL